MRFERYIGWMFGALLAGILASVTLNLVVDPYGIWRLFEVEGFNAAKSERRDQAHMFKAADLIRDPPDVLILGSSRVAYGLDPGHPALATIGRAYNAALPGGNIGVIRRYLEHSVANGGSGPRAVILGLDFFDFNDYAYRVVPATYDMGRLRRATVTARDTAVSLFTLDAVAASLRTIGSNLSDPRYQPYFANGQLTAIDMARSVEARGMLRRFRMSLNLYLNGGTRLRRFRHSDDALAELRAIVALCKARSIALRLFIQPTHAAHMEAIRMRGLWPAFEDWKRRLSRIADYWDFSGYNRITGEAIADRMANYWDVSHYRSRVGDMVLGRLLGVAGRGAPAGFGVPVTRDNVEAHLAEIRRARGRWAADNAERIRWIRGFMKGGGPVASAEVPEPRVEATE